jgi:signal transduction histidine kinase
VNATDLWPLLNLIGIVVPLGFSLGIASYHDQRYFRCWTSSYAWAFLSLLLETVGVRAGHPIGPTSVEILAYLASAWYTLETGHALTRTRRRPALVWGLMACAFTSYVAAALTGQPFDTAVVPTILFYIGTQVALGIQLIRSSEGIKDLRNLLGWSVIVTGLWVLAYPVLAKTAYLWTGFAVAGLLHLLVGIGMVIYLLSDVARQLRGHNERLQAIDRLQQNFIGTMSHEFRTPLNAIQSGAWLLNNLRDASLTGKQQEVLDIIAFNAGRAIAVVDDVLDVSKLESGTMAYELADEDLKDLVAEAGRGMAHVFEEKGIALALELPPRPVMAPLDAKRIGQVLANLLANAAKFTPAGGRVTLRLVGHGATARLEVEDDGIGVPAEQREQIFLRFYQVDNTSRRRAGGTGLGLAIARAIVCDGHGGRIYVQPNPGPGTTFVVELPMLPAAVAAGSLVS